jgi:hypothetical protein
LESVKEIIAAQSKEVEADERIIISKAFYQD